jgi:DNA modification methylase
MGSGSTIAAAKAVGYASTGLEIDAEYFQLAEKAIPCSPPFIPTSKARPSRSN